MLCTTCLTEVVTDLRQIVHGGILRTREHARGNVDDYRPGLYEELVTTLARQHQFGTPMKTSGGSDQPVMFHKAASEAKWMLENTISTWARDFAETYTHLTLTATTTVEAAGWMADFAGLLADHPAAGELHDEITSAVRTVRRVIDRPADKVYLGQCGYEVGGEVCPEDLYCTPEQTWVHCPTCGSDWDTQARRKRLLEVAEDQLDTATNISRALSRLARPVSAAAIRGYAHRGKLTPHPPRHDDPRKDPLYRIGDVLDLLHDTQKEAS
ncbi:hypothetical protein [Amycolatopsis palatopharyngis]|uniref:hypothetical protein n=1 Tax=Amycolatopsis palatopharyngis TaxID=187982 RepID=UPI000E21F767|nr:hypothetical protein [Amycolatopsis palatopharyngis]